MNTKSKHEKSIRAKMDRSGRYSPEISFLSIAEIIRLLTYNYEIIEKSSGTIDDSINRVHKQIIEEFEGYLNEFSTLLSSKISRNNRKKS